MVDLTPGSPEWCRRVSPSKAAAILGVSPWDSQRSMWHKMRGEVPWDDETEAMERGTLCEPAVLAWWRKHHEHTDWREQVSLTVGDWLVATPDGVANTPDGPVLVQAKTTGSNMDEWGDPGTEAVPTHILVQVYLEMAVAHRNDLPVIGAHVPVLGGYRNLFSNYYVPYDAASCDGLMERMKAWADRLDGDDAPELDDSVSTYEAVRKVHPEIDPKAEAEVTEEQAVELLRAVECLDACKARDRKAKADVIAAMGRANYAVCDGVRVARRQGNKGGVSFVPLPKNLPLLTLGETA